MFNEFIIINLRHRCQPWQYPFGNPLCYLDDKMQRYLKENPTEVEGEARWVF